MKKIRDFRLNLSDDFHQGVLQGLGVGCLIGCGGYFVLGMTYIVNNDSMFFGTAWIIAAVAKFFLGIKFLSKGRFVE